MAETQLQWLSHLALVSQLPEIYPSLRKLVLRYCYGSGVEGRCVGGLIRLVCRPLPVHTEVCWGGHHAIWPLIILPIEPQGHAVFVSDQPLQVWCPLPFHSWQSFDCSQATSGKGSRSFVLFKFQQLPTSAASQGSLNWNLLPPQTMVSVFRECISLVKFSSSQYCGYIWDFYVPMCLNFQKLKSGILLFYVGLFSISCYQAAGIV